MCFEEHKKPNEPGVEVSFDRSTPGVDAFGKSDRWEPFLRWTIWMSQSLALPIPRLVSGSGSDGKVKLPCGLRVLRRSALGMGSSQQCGFSNRCSRSATMSSWRGCSMLNKCSIHRIHHQQPSLHESSAIH